MLATPPTSVAVELRFLSAQYGQPRRVLAELDGSLTVGGLKEMLADSMGLPYDEQMMYLSDGEPLRDNRALAELCTGAQLININVTLDGRGPTLQALRPTQGLVHGGQTVELFVLRLPNAALCRFGGHLLPIQRRGEALYVVSPPHAPGPASVEVSADGVHFTHSGLRFLYIDPRGDGDEAIAVRTPARSCYSNEIRRVGLEAVRTTWRPDDPGGCV